MLSAGAPMNLRRLGGGASAGLQVRAAPRWHAGRPARCRARGIRAVAPCAHALLQAKSTCTTAWHVHGRRSHAAARRTAAGRGPGQHPPSRQELPDAEHVAQPQEALELLAQQGGVRHRGGQPAELPKSAHRTACGLMGAGRGRPQGMRAAGSSRARHRAPELQGCRAAEGRLAGEPPAPAGGPSRRGHTHDSSWGPGGCPRHPRPPPELADAEESRLGQAIPGCHACCHWVSGRQSAPCHGSGGAQGAHNQSVVGQRGARRTCLQQARGIASLQPRHALATSL